MPGNGSYKGFFILCLPLLWVTASHAERAAPVTEPSSAAIEQRLQNIERLLQNQGLLDMLQQIKQLQQEVTNLRGQIEVNNHELSDLKEKQRKLYNDIDQRLQQLQGQQSSTAAADTETPPLETMSSGEDIAPSGEEASSTLTVENVQGEEGENGTTEPGQITVTEEASTEEPPLEEAPDTASGTKPDPLVIQSEYQEAFNLLRDAQYDQAITSFDRFLAKYPDSQYSDNAQYWLGEAYYVTRRFNDAITEYMKLVSNYPDSQKVPNSLLKIGYSYYEIGQKKEAEKILNDLIRDYPGTTAATDAEKRLQGNSAT